MINIDTKQRAADKLARIPIKIITSEQRLPKPDWIRIKLPSNNKIAELKNLLRSNRMVTVCEKNPPL